jgi:hypothetical protein
MHQSMSYLNIVCKSFEGLKLDYRRSIAGSCKNNSKNKICKN